MQASYLQPAWRAAAMLLVTMLLSCYHQILTRPFVWRNCKRDSVAQVTCCHCLILVLLRAFETFYSVSCWQPRCSKKASPSNLIEDELRPSPSISYTMHCTANNAFRDPLSSLIKICCNTLHCYSSSVFYKSGDFLLRPRFQKSVRP